MTNSPPRHRYPTCHPSVLSCKQRTNALSTIHDVSNIHDHKDINTVVLEHLQQLLEKRRAREKSLLSALRDISRAPADTQKSHAREKSCRAQKSGNSCGLYSAPLPAHWAVTRCATAVSLSLLLAMTLCILSPISPRASPPPCLRAAEAPLATVASAPAPSVAYMPKSMPATVGFRSARSATHMRPPAPTMQRRGGSTVRAGR